MPGRLAAALAVGGAFAVAAARAGVLTRPAAAWAGALAAAIVGIGGAAWAVPSLLFLAGSAALSRLGGAGGGGAAAGKERRGARDAGQVGANGGVAGALVLAAPWAPGEAALCYWGFVGAFAAAAADTWATEVGRHVGGRPISLRTGRPVAAGVSGAVSVAGTLAALGGAGGVALGAGPFAHPPVLPPEASALAAVGIATGAGVAGAFADSLAGAFVQARYRDARTGRRTEAPFAADGRPNERLRGVPGLTNDGVNLLCTLVGAAGAMGGVAAL